MGQPERSELSFSVLEGGYRLGAVIGVGGTSAVFEATRVADGWPVVVKVLKSTFVTNAELMARLRREAEVARLVPHPGIVRSLDSGMLPDGSPYVVMERLEGECLARVLNRMRPLPAPHVCAIALRVASILHAVHARGYVHRDIKPEHIMLDRTPDGCLDVRLIDFGVCASAGAPEAERQAERGRVYGTPAYVSPEQACGEPYLDGRADLFGLGVVMFEALVGRVPFTGATVAKLLKRIIREDPPRVGLLLPHLPLEVDEVVARAMARERDRRFSSARALARALLPLIHDRRQVEAEVAALIERSASVSDSVPTLNADRAA